MRRQIAFLGMYVFMAGAAWAQRRPDPFANQRDFFQTNPVEEFGIRLTILVVPFIVGALIGAFFSPRFADIRKFVLLAAAALLGLVFLIGPAWVVALLGTPGAVIAFIVGLVAGFGQFMATRQRPTTFGSAEWAGPEEIQKSPLLGNKGLFLGEFPLPASKEQPDSMQALYYTGDRHGLTVAPTRGGKGVGTIIPNLLTYDGSLLTIDPKGENALVTVPARQGLKQAVHLVDPWGIAAPQLKLTAARLNPLDWLKPNDPDLAENAMLLADALVVKSDGAANPFWDEEAKSLLSGIILYVATDPREADTRHLGRVRDLLMQDKTGLDELFAAMLLSQHPVVVGTGARSMQKDSELLSNVLASAQSHTHFLDSPRIRESLSASDFSFEDLKTSKTSIYLVLPADRLSTFGRWLRLLIQQAITVNARNIDIRPEKPILFMLDELPSLGRLAMIEQAYGLMAGFGMQLWGVVQDFSQMKRIYGDGWETFVANSGVIQYFGSRDKMTAEYFSKLCGVTTVVNLSTAIANALSSTWAGLTGATRTEGRTSTTTEALAQRSLAYPDELMTLRSDKQLLLVENMNPIQARKIRWFEHPAFRSLGRDLRRAGS